MIYDVTDYIQGVAPLGSAVACPFHDDRRASAMVMSDSGRLWCFRCQQGCDQVGAAVRLWFSDLPWDMGVAMAEALIKERGWAMPHPTPSERTIAPSEPALIELMTRWCHVACLHLATSPAIIQEIIAERAVREPIKLGVGLASSALFEHFVADLPDELHHEALLIAAGLLYADPVEVPWPGRYRLGDRLILPEIRGEPKKVIHFQARAQERDARVRYLNPKGIARPIYGWESLGRERPYVWLLEGVFDLYPLLEAGEAALSVNGIGFDSRQLDGLKVALGTRPLLIAFDNDPPNAQGERPGLTAAVKRQEAFLAEGITAMRYLPPNPYKDVGDWIVARGVEHVIKIAEWDAT